MAFPRPVRRRVVPAEGGVPQTFDVGVAASSDDAFQNPFGTTLTGHQGVSDAVDEWFGMRFLNVTVPNGATIDAAYITVDVYNGNFDEPDHPIYCEAADDPVTFATTPDTNISDRSRTSSVTWSSTDLGGPGIFNSVDIATPVQEVVDRGGWVSGQAMVVIMNGSAVSTRDLGFRFFDHPDVTEPLIHIEFTA